MARIRTLKPEFWQDEKLAQLDATTRLVFLGLISQADDAGRLVDNVKLLDGLLFPFTDDTCRGALEVLAQIGRVERYETESGQRLIQLTGWEKHQKVDKPSRYVLPAPTGVRGSSAPPSGHMREVVANVSRDSRAPTLDLGPTITDQQKDAKASLSGSGKPNADEAVRVVWTKWVEESGRSGSELTPERRKKIKTRLRSFTVDQLCAAIESAHRNPFYLGENDRQTYFGNIETIFKNDTAVAAHLEWAQENPPVRRLTLHVGGLSTETPQEANRRTESADAAHASRVADWRQTIAERFAAEPVEKREGWKQKVAPNLVGLKERRPLEYPDALKLAVYRAYGESVGMPEPVRGAA